MIQSRKIERVFLLFPPGRASPESMKQLFTPLGISYIAATIRGEVEVEIMDAAAEGFSREEVLEDGFIRFGSSLAEIRSRIEKFKPDLVGVTCLFSSVFPMVREVCQEVKKIDPGILTITGGTYPTFMAEYCLTEPSLDLICLGEGELTTLELIRRLNQGQSIADLDGLAYKDGDRVVATPRATWVEDLDSLPFPARDLLPLELYKKFGVPHSFSLASPNNAPLLTSRGCPAHCIYCSSTRYWGNRYRFRSPGNVLAEIDELVNKWGIEEIQFEDDNVTANRERARAIFQGIIDRGYNLKFNFPNGVALWTLDEELIDLMVKAGAYEMTLAFESGCQEVLSKIVRKPLNLEKARRITAYIKSKNLRTNAFYIFGFPGETKEQMRETFKFAHEMKTDTAYFFVANPLPGTEMHRIMKERDMLRDDFSFENLSFTRSSYHDGIFKEGELESMAGREFFKYNFRSFLRHPWTMIRKSVVDMFLKRPRYTIGLLLRIWRRNRW